MLLCNTGRLQTADDAAIEGQLHPIFLGQFTVSKG